MQHYSEPSHDDLDLGGWSWPPFSNPYSPSYSTYFRTTSLFTPLMWQIVGIHVKHAKMCQVIRHAKMCKGMSMRVRDYQDNKREKEVKLQGNEHIIWLISRQFTFSKRGMLGTSTLGGNRCQVHSKCQVSLCCFSSTFQQLIITNKFNIKPCQIIPRHLNIFHTC